ncbi:hypothetical protein B0H16DRAFT_1860669 [Mycena metata]|uniref:Uncharacterized protein n=1 Tax=Mycena metata TaxID=1033252 RepID=A0AAD7N3H7_9AGAR|nr:hypothetical protein B0H16DRAFT_1860669 [Mycena metata]
MANQPPPADDNPRYREFRRQVLLSQQAPITGTQVIMHPAFEDISFMFCGQVSKACLMVGDDGNLWPRLLDMDVAHDLASIPVVSTMKLTLEDYLGVDFSDIEITFEVSNPAGVTVLDIINALANECARVIQTSEGPMPLAEALNTRFFEGLSLMERTGDALKGYIDFGS